MTDKQINRWLRRRFSLVGWVLVFYYFLLNAMVTLGMLWEWLNQTVWSFAAGDFSGNVDWDILMGNAWGYIVAILAGFAILHAWKGGEFFSREILRKEEKMRPSVLLRLLILCMAAQMVNALWVSGLEMVMNGFGESMTELLESVTGDSDTFSMFLYASILAPVAEEVLFRGYVLRSLRPFGKRFAIFGSALLFGVYHGNLLQAPYTFLVGLILGYVTVEYSIGWAVVIHMFNNLVLADLLTRLTAGWSDMAYGLFYYALFGGSFLLGLGMLIRRRREIRTYQYSEWMDRRVVKCFFLNSGVLVVMVITVVNMLSLLFA